MKTILAILLLTPVLASAQASAINRQAVEQAPRTRAHTPEWTNPTTGDPGVAESTTPELQRIVVLCATEPASARFRNEWSAYVKRHYRRGMDVDALIDDVLARAETYREKTADRQKTDRSTAARAIESSATRKAMHDAAMSSVRNMK